MKLPLTLGVSDGRSIGSVDTYHSGDIWGQYVALTRSAVDCPSA
jgi:hypothetical protein